MTHLNILLLLSFLAFSNGLLLAQETAEDIESASRWGIHWAPLSLLQLRPRFRVGFVQARGRSARSLDLEFNGPTNGVAYDAPCNIGLPLKMFFGIQPEIKLYKKKRPKDGTFVALTGMLNYSKSQVADFVYLYEEGYSVDDADRNDLRLALIAKVGRTWRLGDGGYFEFYTGIGGGVGHYSYENYGPAIGEDEYAQCGHSIRQAKKTELRPEIHLGVKLGTWLN